MEYWMASNQTGQNDREDAIQEVLRDPGSAVLFVDYPRWLLRFAATCCVVFMLIGIPGNFFTVVALLRTRKLRNATAIFIINLSISDLMFCCFNLPLATSTFWHSSWHHGALLCRLFPLLRYGLVAVSLFTVLAITINRYVMIGHPRLYVRLYKPRYLIPMVLSTWLIAFGILIVTWFESWGRFGLDPAIGSCSILPDVNRRSPKEFLFVVAFLTPCLAIVVCYARIFYIVRRTACKSRKRNKAAVEKNAEKKNDERRSVSPRSPQDEELSVFTSSCAGNVFCANLSAKRGIPSTNRLDYSRTPSRSVFEDSFSEREPTVTLKDKEDVVRYKKHDEPIDKGQKSKENLKIGEDDRTEDEISFEKSCDKGKSSFDVRIDDIPFADDVDVPETIFPGLDRQNTKDSKIGKKRFERMASRASFVVESALWIHRLNSKTSMDPDRLDSSRSNTPDRPEKRKIGVTSKQSKMKRIKRSKSLDTRPRMSNKDRKLLKMILVIFSSFLVCYLPITVAKTFKDTIDWRGFNIAGYILIYLTTCINPVIYVVMSSEYRSAYKNLLLCRTESSTKTANKKSPG